MEIHDLPYEATTIQRKLTLDYLNHTPQLAPFFDYTPDSQGTAEAIEQRQAYPVDRDKLTKVLREQYMELDAGFFENPDNRPVAENIESLEKATTFTVTTGHQLNILGGPLYYFYKIASTIHLAQKLNHQYPDSHFVPIYWMGSEDHDFEEINHVHLFGKTYQWDKPADGAVGALDPSSLVKVVEEVEADIKEKADFQPLADLWKTAFQKFDTFARATQYWLNELMKEYGLVILDPDHPELKTQLAPVIEEDLLNQTHHALVNNVAEKLDQYELPVNPREINLFYTKSGLRERIVKNGGGYEVVNTDLQFSKEELINQLKSNPEHFSPNVVLRPLYQQMILPNISYIGGTNEVAYWFELKSIFDHHQAFFPQLLVRSSGLWIGKGLGKKMRKFGLRDEDLFRDTDQVIREYLAEKEDTSVFDDKLSELETAYNQLMEACRDYSDELKWPIVNLAKEHLKGLEKLQKDTRKLLKKRNEKDIDQIRKVYDALFPEGVPQERHENFIPYYLKYGKGFFDQLVKNMDPVEQKLIIFKE